jgi:hypothetical protein
MLRAVSLLVLLGLALPAYAEDKKVSFRFLGGAKKVPLEGLKVTIRAYTGDATADEKAKPLTDGKTDKEGTALFTLAEGYYYVQITSDKELPYLYMLVGDKSKGSPGRFSEMIRVGKETAFEFNLADACKLILRAVDENGKGMPGVSFMMMSQTAEYSSAVIGDILGVDRQKQGKDVSDKDGYLVRYMGPWDGYTYFAWPTPEGYEVVGNLEVEIPTPLGKEKAEHTFKFKKK